MRCRGFDAVIAAKTGELTGKYAQMKNFKPLAAMLGGVLAVGMSACGHNMEQRAATGAAAGLIVGGPVGAVVGAAAGAVVNEIEDEEQDADESIFK